MYTYLVKSDSSLPLEFIDYLRRNIMSETQQTAAVSNIAGGAMIVIILVLAGIIVHQQSQLTSTIKEFATFYGKCLQLKSQ